MKVNHVRVKDVRVLVLHGTAKALLSRGLPGDVAVQLSNEGYTLKKLKLMPKEELVRLGLGEDFINKIKKEPRPPIPNEVLNELLHESKYCCCICRDENKPIVVHHIIPWETSHSHDKENLAVLCTEHHDEAHTKHGLSINLTPERIRFSKESWLEEVRRNDSNTILSIVDSEYACWDYFNILRLFELAMPFDIDYTKFRTYEYLYRYGYIDQNGFLKPFECWGVDNKIKFHWLDFMNGMYICNYLAEIFKELIPRLPIKILNDIWNKSKIRSFIKSGDIIVIQGAFYFKSTNKSRSGEGQIRYGYRAAKGIKMEFTFDAWYSTSSSAQCIHLKGHQVETVFAIVREVKEDGKYLTLRCTAIAIGSCFKDFDNGRFFTSVGYSDYDYDEEDEEDEEDDDEPKEYDEDSEDNGIIEGPLFEL